MDGKNMKLIWSNQKGFTLVEVLITIAIIAISIGLSTFGLQIVYDSRTEGAAKNFESDLKTIRLNSITYTDRKYYLQWKYDASTGYSYEIVDFNNPTSPDNSIKTVQIHKKIDIQVIKNSGTAQSLKDLLAEIPTKVMQVTIMFGKNGEIIPFTIGGETGDGEYVFRNSPTDTKSYTITIRPVTGGISFDE